MKVAIVGATGAVGQRFISLLQDHPWFKITALVASERSAGKTYAEAANWVLNDAMPKAVASMPVLASDDRLDADLVFSAIPSGTAGPIEEKLSGAGLRVFSNARDHRMEADVPLLIPEVNPEHVALVEVQKRRRRTDGYIVTNPNCAAVVVTMSWKPLHEKFKIKKAVITTMQAISGAGYPGVPSLDITANVIPFIGGGEEEKVQTEPLKMLGNFENGAVKNAAFPISATCTRVPVEEGHSAVVNLEFERITNENEILETWSQWTAEPQKLKTPLAPLRPLHVKREENRPQPRRDWNLEKGMAVSVGRLRKDNVLHYKYFVSGSNTVRGAAGGSILNAELMYAKKML